MSHGMAKRASSTLDWAAKQAWVLKPSPQIPQSEVVAQS